MATTLEQALASSIANFHERSAKEGDEYQLSKGELKEPLSFKVVSMGTEQLDERSFWVLLKDLEDKDNMMDFKEYMVFLDCLSMFCNDFCAKAPGPLCSPAAIHPAVAAPRKAPGLQLPLCGIADLFGQGGGGRSPVATPSPP
ncbi:protein S100-A2-like [Gavia stellata]|uniref:protein S100-A2-like n=1 Tax=Gavia stellata TaxID=37040 RepID=UPI00289E01B3|nr:protein S100-A2-like [Gavia stellata]